MASARPVGRTEVPDVAAWHQRIIASRAGPLRAQISQPGKLWDQLAGDLLLANLDSPLWGWANHDSLWLLEYWLELSPDIHALLLCVSPRSWLAQVLLSDELAPGVQAIMDQWQSQHEQLLQVHLRHPQRTLLVDAEDCLAHPRALVERCIAAWQLPLRAEELARLGTPRPASDPLTRYLAAELLRDQAAVASLQRELDMVQTRLGPDERSTDESASLGGALTDATGFADQPPISVLEVVVVLREQRHELQSLHAAQERVGEHNAALEKTLKAVMEDAAQRTLQLGQALKVAEAEAFEQAERVSVLNTHVNQLDRALEQLEQEKTCAESRHEAAEAENKRLHIQLKQLQEALERYVLQHQEAKQDMEQWQQDLARQKAEREKLAAELKAAQAETAEQKVEATKQKAESDKAIEAVRAEAVTQAARVGELSARIDQIEQDKADAEAKRAEADEENELLLAQLHQVQEELERYFLQHQEAQQHSEQLRRNTAKLKAERDQLAADLQTAQAKAEQRWQQLLAQTPNASRYSAITVTADDAKLGQHALGWQLQQWESASRRLPRLSVGTVLERGMAGLVFTRGSASHTTLLRWPWSAAHLDRLVLLPKGAPFRVAACRHALEELSTSDWLLLQDLQRALSQALEVPRRLALPPGYPIAELRDGLQRFADEIALLPPALRYDRVGLQREALTATDQQLWLHLTEPSLGEHRWPSLECRLICPDSDAEPFGTEAALLMPATGGQPPLREGFAHRMTALDGLLLGFTPQPGAADDADDHWQRLTAPEQGLIIALIERLPQILLDLKHAGINVERPWADWIGAAEGLRQHLGDRLASARRNLPPAVIEAAEQSGASSAQTKTPRSVLADA